MDKDRLIIKNKLINYAIALDRKEWPSLDIIFHQDALAEYGDENIGLLIKSSSRKEIVDMCKSSLGGCGFTQHLLGNFRITVDDDNAFSKCYVRVYHVGMPPNENEFYEMFGEYQDEWKKTNNSWLIVKRKLRVDHERGNRDKVLAPGN